MKLVISEWSYPLGNHVNDIKLKMPSCESSLAIAKLRLVLLWTLFLMANLRAWTGFASYCELFIFCCEFFFLMTNSRLCTGFRSYCQQDTVNSSLVVASWFMSNVNASAGHLSTILAANREVSYLMLTSYYRIVTPRKFHFLVWICLRVTCQKKNSTIWKFQASFRMDNLSRLIKPFCTEIQSVKVEGGAGVELQITNVILCKHNNYTT